jgi:hypothetical protein
MNGQRFAGPCIVVAMLAVCALGPLASCAAERARTAILNSAALACARASVADFESDYAGTDQAIVDCYLDRGLPYPEGV